MKRPQRMTSIIFGSITLSLGLLTISPLFAQTTSTGPYYATPSWDQTLPSATRFIILSNFDGNAVLDRNTGLVWEKSPEFGMSSWNGAKDACIKRRTGGQMGWRLPAVAELASLVSDKNVPLLPEGHPFIGFNHSDSINLLFGFWTATAHVDPEAVWTVTFKMAGAVFLAAKDTGTSGIWCVRGGSNPNPY